MEHEGTDPAVWEPPALLARLTVGTRVRIRVSPEAVFTCGCTYTETSLRMSKGEFQGTIEAIAGPSQDALCTGCGQRTLVGAFRFGVRLTGSPTLTPLPAAALTPIEEEQHADPEPR